MSRDYLVDSIGNIDDDMIETADKLRTMKKKKVSWPKWCAMAACFAAVVIAGICVLHDNHTELTSIGGVMREYTNATVKSEETAVEWPWEYKTVNEKFPTILYNGKEYTVKTIGLTIDQALLGEKLGFGEGVGYDVYTEKEYRQDFAVWQVEGISSDLMIAAEMNGQFYPFQCSAYAPPAVLGEILDNFSLPQTLVLDHFSVSVDGKEKGYYTLLDDNHIWQILNGSRDAQFIEDKGGGMHISGDFITFTVTSQALGVYKRALYVTADGYVRTNIFDWAYTFYIGEDRAADIISYAKKNAVKAEQEPYIYSLAGTLTEIGDGYILVDDSILCADEEDGMVFKVLTTDLRVSRCIDYQKIGVGSIVVVRFTEPIHMEAGNVVAGAVSMDKGYLFDDSISIPE